MLVSVYGSAVFGGDAQCITIEVNIDKGIGYHLVGLPDNAVRESTFRIAAALKNIGLRWKNPTHQRRFVHSHSGA